MSLATDGFQIVRSVLGPDEVESFKQLMADLPEQDNRSSCLRFLAAKIPEAGYLALSEKIRSLLPKSEMQLVRSLLFDKTPERNWSVAWHQDITIAVREKHELPGFGPWTVKEGVHHVQPTVEILNQMATVRIQLDETPPSNGALRVIPESHRYGILSSDELETRKRSPECCLACRAGDAIVMNPLLVHSSRRSTQPSHRRVLHFEYAVPGILPEPFAWADG